MNIGIIGTGYVGLVVGTCLADFGMNVVCVDNDKSKIDLLLTGETPIHEIGLGEMIQRNLSLQRLTFSTDLESAIKSSEVLFLAVGTPEENGGSSDLSQLYKVAGKIGRLMTSYKVIVTKSTVPVGTARKLRALIEKERTGEVEFDIVSNPEFLREGSAVDDFLRPDRVVIGGESEQALDMIEDIYRPLLLKDTPVLRTSHETAELIKYAANTMLALKVSFVNEIANLCELVGADVSQVASAVGLDKRIGPSFLHPGPGFGGSCLPKDVAAIVQSAQTAGYEFKLAESAIAVNERQKKLVVDKCRKALGSFENRTVTLLGLSFKPDTDDIRESPALFIAAQILSEGGSINAYDPAAMEQAAKTGLNIKLCDNAYEACRKTDLVLILTEWNEFQQLDLARLKEIVRNPVFYDCRNIYDPQRVRQAGFKYMGTGRPCGSQV